MLSNPDFQEKDRLAQVLSRAGSRKAKRYGLNDADADDAVQEVGLHVLLEKFDAVLLHANPEAFLISKVGYRCLDKHKEHGQRVQREVSLTQGGERAGIEDRQGGVSHLARTPEPLTVPHPVERVIALEEARERVAKVKAVVRGLSPKRRRIFGQCIVRKRSRKAVAEELEMSYGALRNEVVEIKKLLYAAVFGAQDE